MQAIPEKGTNNDDPFDLIDKMSNNDSSAEPQMAISTNRSTKQIKKNRQILNLNRAHLQKKV